MIKKDQLEKIRHFLALGYYDSVIKESSTLFEVILKKIYARALSEFGIEDRSTLLESEALIGKKVKGYTQFGFGELVGLFNRSKLLEKWEKNTHQDLGIIRSISLDYMVTLRNQLTHNSDAHNKSSKGEAELIYSCLTNWLSFIGYSELDSGIQKAMMQATESDNTSDVYEKHLRSKTESNYSSSTQSEVKRLSIQAMYSKESDEKGFLYALKRIGEKENLIGLDIGCADGFLTAQRFKAQYGFTQVIGIDKNEALIANAHKKGLQNFHFYPMNIEEDTFEMQLDHIKQEHKIELFDIIFISYTLHHLKEPVRFLRKIRKHLSPDGAVIITGVDDGAQLAYDDQNLVQEIVNLSVSTKNISDRFGARKFYSYLKNAGFNTVKLFYGMNDTSTMTPEEREMLFQYYFSFRKDYTQKQLNTDVDNQTYVEHHRKMITALEQLEDVFHKPDFYYLVTVLTAVAFKS